MRLGLILDRFDDQTQRAHVNSRKYEPGALIPGIMERGRGEGGEQAQGWNDRYKET